MSGDDARREIERVIAEKEASFKLNISFHATLCNIQIRREIEALDMAIDALAAREGVA